MKTAHYESDLVNEIDSVLACDCTRLGLVGGTSFGAEGLYGLHLVANCLWQAYQTAGQVNAVDPPVPPPSGKQATELAKVKKRLARVLQHTKVPVAVCYHLDGTGEWNLALSPDLSLDDAWEMLTGFLQGSMDFEVVA
jgi:hypothetical protein